MRDPQAHSSHRPTPEGHAPRCLAIVPVFNERSSVGKVIERLRRALPEFDVVVIDDGSTDDTLRQVPAGPGVTVVGLPFNLGIGGAMQTGYRYAALHGYDVAVQVDGDGQHRPSEVRRLVDHLLEGHADLVVGSRFLVPSKHYRQSPVRWAGAWILKAWLRLLSGLTITDCTSGFRAANRKVIRAFAHWYPEDYPEPEVILLLHRAGYRVRELCVRMRQRRGGQSSIGVFAGLFYVLKVTTCLLLDTARAPWPEGKVGDVDPLAPSRTKAPDLGRELLGSSEAAGVSGAGAGDTSRGDAYVLHQEPDPAAAWRGPAGPGRAATPPV